MMCTLKRTSALLLALTLVGSLCMVSALAADAENAPAVIAIELSEEERPSQEALAEPADSVEAAVQEGSGDAAQKLMSSFASTATGSTLYPSDYAGCWLDGSTLYIAVTKEDDATLARYRALTGNYEDVRFVLARYPYGDLLAYQQAAMQAASASRLVYASYPDVKQNLVVMEVEPSSINDVWTILENEIGVAALFGTGAPVPSVDRAFQVQPGEPAFTSEAAVLD